MSSTNDDSSSLGAKEAALAIIPKITGGLSLLGSLYIAQHVLRDAKKRTKTYHRLLVIMSLCDAVSSLSYFMSTWPIPQGINHGWNNPSHYAALGNDATCTAQGVGIQWGVTTAVLNVALAVHYLLVVRYNFGETTLRKMQVYVLLFALLAALSLTIPGIVLGMFGNTNLWCWIAPDFVKCQDQGLTRQECVDQAYHWRWSFYYGPIWACIGLITAAQVALWWTVRAMETRASRWRQTDPRSKRYRQSRAVACQAARYVSVFYVTWLPYTAIAATGKFFNPHDNFGVLLLVVTCQPLQGFLNVLVYRHLEKNNWKAGTAISDFLSRVSTSLQRMRVSIFSASATSGTSEESVDIVEESQPHKEFAQNTTTVASGTARGESLTEARVGQDDMNVESSSNLVASKGNCEAIMHGEPQETDELLNDIDEIYGD